MGLWMGNVNPDRSLFKSFMEEIREDIKEIRKNILDIFKRLPPAPVITQSPMHLSDFGKEIAKQINAEEWAGQLAPALKKRAEGKQPYEIQELCSNYVQKEVDPDPEQSVNLQTCAYEMLSITKQ